MELRFHVDDRLIERLQERIGDPSARGADLALAGLTMLEWGTAQANAGRQLASTDVSGNHVCGWECPIVTRARDNREV